MMVFNAGDRIMNTWVYEGPNGYVMIDTGYPGKLESVGRRLAAQGVGWQDIRLVFLTHAHDDHAGFLNELLAAQPHIQVVLNPASIPALRRGQNSFAGGCSTLGAHVFCRLMALWGKGKHLFPPLEERFDDRLLFVTDETRPMLEGLLGGKIIPTPGHTADHISLMTGGLIFCGDAAMDGFPSSHHVTIWVENVEEFARSWSILLDESAEMLYPAHGKPFAPAELAACRDFASAVRLRPLSPA